MRIACVALLALAACGKAKTEVVTLPTDGSLTGADLRVESGNITVSTGSSASGETTLSWKGGEKPLIDARIAANVLIVEASCPKKSKQCVTDFVLNLPAALDLDVTLDAGDVVVTGLAGNVEIDVNAGNVNIIDTTGDVTVGTTAGNIDFTNAAGRLEATALAGTLTAANLTAQTLTGETGAGNVDVTFIEQPGLVEITTDAGDVLLRVPGGGDVEYDITLSTRRGEDEVFGVVNVPGAAASIRVTSDSGNIEINTPEGA